MALGYLTSNSLIQSIKRRAMIPSNQSTFSDADFLALANDELKIGLLPSILSVQEEYYVFAERVKIEPNKSAYSIPYRAIGSKLRDVFYVDNSGSLLEMSRISADDKALYQNEINSSRFVFYYIENNSIVFTSKSSSTPTGELLFTYFIRPSDLVDEKRISVITNIQKTNDNIIFTVDKIHPDFTTSNRKLDLLQAKPGHRIRNIDINATINTTNRTLTFNINQIDSDVEVGDHIALAGECMIPQCPSDLHSVLAQRVAARCLEALGDTQGLANANKKLQEMEMKTMQLVDNRVIGAPQKVVNNRGLLRFSKIRRKRWY
jgi:hypothetical protein